MWLKAILTVIGVLSIFSAPLGHSHPLDHDGQKTLENWKSSTEESYRLPREIIPISYDLWLHTALGKGDFSYQGRVNITLRVQNATDTIAVHNDNSVIHYNKTLITGKWDEPGNSMVIDHQRYDKERQFHIVKLQRELSPGYYSLVLDFEGVVHDDVFGFYRTSYEVNGQIRYMGVTQFSPTYARRAFPCMDEPHLKATFSLQVVHPNNQRVTSNTPVKSTSAYLNDSTYCITTFSKTPRISTYLVGWTVHDFVSQTSNASENFTIWTRPSMSTRGSLALNIGQSIYSSLASWLEVESPIKKMDQFAVPDFNFHAMENWGLITFRETVALAETNSTPTRFIMDGLTTLAHEYGHTWFGNLVTPEFWDVVWLKEGFASYFQYFGLELIRPDLKMMNIFVVDTLQPTLLADSVEHNRTMNGRGVGSPSSIMAALDFVSYRKGASVIRMLSHVIGTTAFQAGLRSYLRAMSYNAASPYDLYEHLQAAVNSSQNTRINVRDFMESWTTQIGYPVVNVSRNYTSQQLLVSQERFYQDRSQSANDNERSRWWIPLNIATKSSPATFANTTTTHWLSPVKPTLNLGPVQSEDWLILNVQEIGYYRVNYDVENWQLLIDQMTSSQFRKIHTVNRAALLDDAFNLARGGYIDYSIPFNLSRYLIQEEDYVPWVAAINNFNFLNSMLSSVPKVQPDFQRFVAGLLEPMYKRFGFIEAAHEHWITKLHRELILSASCSVNSTHCLRTSKTLFGSWIGSADKTILKDVKSFVYCHGIQGGTEDDWYATWNRLRSYTDLHTEQELLLRALGCTQKAGLIDKYLDWAISIDSNIRKQYRILAFNAVLDGSPSNVLSVLNYVSRYHEKVIDLAGHNFFSKVISAIGIKITTERQLEQLQKFVNDNADHLGDAFSTAQQAVLRGKSNINWIRRYSADIARCLV